MSTAGSSSLSTTRSRTLLFISYRDSRARSTRFSRASTSYDEPYGAEDENDTLINPSPGHVTLDAELPPKWVDLSEQVEEILRGTQANVVALEKLHAKHALPGFADRTAEEREIEAATTEITKHEGLAAKNVQRGLAARVQELSSTFRKKQRVYMERLQGHAIKNQDLLIASGTISSRGSEGLTAVDEDMEAAQAQILDNVQDHDLRARDRELTEIANSISSLAELFKDLSVLVIDQGTLLDSVEYNIEQTSVEMAEAVKELKVATRYQKNTGRRKIIFLLLLIIFGLIMVLIFKPRRSSTSGSPSTQGFTDNFVPRYVHARTPSPLRITYRNNT
ncbi:hypothetical protein AZE42_05179 [Rhizopogon vesiculosus]|uniref:t-SNARE coiled-coil homology domain-containing protein n=1 Tax=Rhizopogon vesiculosus TaxID=180088 RepID=A0A1J8QE57_9AGAM|nr:hypothetical protein AZE42_05179 [Rhizopogon vesiculosus]